MQLFGQFAPLGPDRDYRLLAPLADQELMLETKARRSSLAERADGRRDDRSQARRAAPREPRQLPPARPGRPPPLLGETRGGSGWSATADRGVHGEAVVQAVGRVPGGNAEGARRRFVGEVARRRSQQAARGS